MMLIHCRMMMLRNNCCYQYYIVSYFISLVCDVMSVLRCSNEGRVAGVVLLLIHYIHGFICSFMMEYSVPLPNYCFVQIMTLVWRSLQLCI